LNEWQLAFGLAFSVLIAWAGYRQRSLSLSGVVGAIIVGTLTFGLGGWTWGLLLIAFFCLFQPSVPLPQGRQAGAG